MYKYSSSVIRKYIKEIKNKDIRGIFLKLKRALILIGRIFDLHSKGWWFESTRALFFLIICLAELVYAADLKSVPFKVDGSTPLGGMNI